jgi:hypothetical protein
VLFLLLLLLLTKHTHWIKVDVVDVLFQTNHRANNDCAEIFFSVFSQNGAIKINELIDNDV